MFRYKTRGTSSPQGKRRVYFTCHPEDFARYFEEIGAEILGISEGMILCGMGESCVGKHKSQPRA